MRYFQNILLVLLTVIVLVVSVSFADVKQLQDKALSAGSAGDFSSAKNDLIAISNTLSNTKLNNTFDEQGRHISAFGFVQIMKRIANDCFSGKLSKEAGKLLFQAVTSAGEGELDKAISLTQKAISSKSQYAPAYALLGRLLSSPCLERGTGCQKSIDAYQTALKHDSSMGITFLDLGMAFTQNQQLELAINTYKSFLDLKVGGLLDGWANEQLALLYAMQKKWNLVDKHSKLSSSLGMPLPDEISEEIKKESRK
jgi:tetratricopeptide (TPR) repeat protein